MDVLAKANAAVQAGADPHEVWKLLDGNPAQAEFGKQFIVDSPHIPAGNEFDEGEPNMDWSTLAASLFSSETTPPTVPAAPGAPRAPGVGGDLTATAGVPAAFAGLGGAVPTNSEGRSLETDFGTGYSAPPPAEDPWYKGLLGSSDGKGNGGLMGQSGYQVAQAPALAAVPAQQRKPREKMEFMIPASLRSLMGG